MKRLLLAAVPMLLMAGCAQTPPDTHRAHLQQPAMDQKNPPRAVAVDRKGMQPPRGPMAARLAPMHATITLTNGVHVEAVGPIRSHSLGGRQFIAFETSEGPMAVRIDQVAVITGVDPMRLFAGEGGPKNEPQARPGEDGAGPGPGMRGPFGGRGRPGMRGPGGGEEERSGPGRGGPGMREGQGPRGEMRDGPRPDRKEDKGEKKNDQKKDDRKEEKKEKD